MLSVQDKGPGAPESLVVESESVECKSRSEALVVRPSTSKMINPQAQAPTLDKDQAENGTHKVAVHP